VTDAHEAGGQAVSLTTKAGWDRFVADTPPLPALLPDEQWKTLDPAERETYDEMRLRHHGRLVTVATPLVNEVIRRGRRLTLLNRDQVTARRGLIVSGPAATGKSTAITQLGKHHEIRTRRQRGDLPGPFMPVVYVTVPPAATPKASRPSSPVSWACRSRGASTRSRSPTPSATCSQPSAASSSWSTSCTTSPCTPATAPRPPTS